MTTLREAWNRLQSFFHKPQRDADLVDHALSPRRFFVMLVSFFAVLDPMIALRNN